MKYRACEHKEVEHAVEIPFLCTYAVYYCAERIGYAACDKQIYRSVVDTSPKYLNAENNHPAERKIQYHLNGLCRVKQEKGHKHCDYDGYPRND